MKTDSEVALLLIDFCATFITQIKPESPMTPGHLPVDLLGKALVAGRNINTNRAKCTPKYGESELSSQLSYAIRQHAWVLQCTLIVR